MSSNAGSHSHTVKRRQSILPRIRPRTAGGEASFGGGGGGGGGSQHVRSRTGVWVPHEDGGYRDAVSHFTHEPVPDLPPAVVDAQGPAPSADAMPKRHHSKSFSGLRNGVDGIRAAVRRRLSVNTKHKPPRQVVPSLPWEEERMPNNGTQHRDTKSSGWVSSQRILRQSSLGSLNLLSQGSSSGVVAPIPGSGSEPPVLPDDLSRGAAARAAAAAQNEMSKLERGRSNEDGERGRDGTLGVKPSLDSESGIEINIGDNADNSEEELEVVRQDPIGALPPELMTQILSFLDAESLKNAERVSHAWNAQAASRHVWREVFRHEYKRPKSSDGKRGKPKALGLGKTVPNRDWKKMFGVRRMLDKRWKEGKAAAIYLHGHKDSVYCVQFDENKIITGSRDRTIRIWDAHFPWPCLKIIGAPSDPGDPAPFGPLGLNPSPESTGSMPFLSICPPSKPASDIVTANSVDDEGDYHRASILCLQFDEEIMVSGSSDHTCIVWDIKNDYKPIRHLEGHTAGVLDVCFDERYIVACSKDATISVWDRHTGELVKKLVGHRGPVNAVQLRGDLIASASGDGVAKLWNITSGLCIKEFASRNRGLACIEFSEDARTILAGGNDQVIYQFDANTGELVKEFNGHTGLVRSLHMDSDSGRVVSGSYDMSVKVFDAQRGDLSIDLGGWTTSWMLSAKSDYRRIVATSQDARAVIMDFGYGLDGIDLLEE